MHIIKLFAPFLLQCDSQSDSFRNEIEKKLLLKNYLINIFL